VWCNCRHQPNRTECGVIADVPQRRLQGEEQHPQAPSPLASRKGETFAFVTKKINLFRLTTNYCNARCRASTLQIQQRSVRLASPKANVILKFRTP
jgi:hypothetical protein